MINHRIKNTIYTGVAGTGKTYHLQQIARQYTDVIAPISQSEMLVTFLQPLTWRDVVVMIFLDYQKIGKDLLTVPEISEHDFFITKANINNRLDKHNKIAHQILVNYSCNEDVSDSDNAVTTKNIDKLSFFIKKDNCWCLHQEVSNSHKSLLNIYIDYKKSTTNSAIQVNSIVNDSKNLSSQITVKRYVFISFHQSYGYDEFVEGVRPHIDETTGQMRYAITDGIFLKICQRAIRDQENRYALFIDEINRANVVQVFGELMTLIESDKRIGADNQLTVQLAYSGRTFGVPSNLDIFATMNTQDHSLVNLDMAFRRRFEFIELLPDSSVLTNILDIENNNIPLSKILHGLNCRICKHVGAQYQLGHAYFIGIGNIFDLLKVMVKQILPQLLVSCQHQTSVLSKILNIYSSDEQDGLQWLADENTLYADNMYNDNKNHDEHSYFKHNNHPISYVVNPKLISIINSLDKKLMNLETVVQSSTVVSYEYLVENIKVYLEKEDTAVFREDMYKVLY